MAVKIRLARRGRKKRAMFDIVIADARAPRDGRFIEKIGTYNPNTQPATVKVSVERAVDWLLKGAQPTDTTRSLLSHEGVMLKKHLQVGVNKGAITQDVADARFAEWQTAKESKKDSTADTLASKKDALKKAQLAAETKINTARAEALAKKNLVVEEAPAAVEPAAEATETPAEETTQE